MLTMLALLWLSQRPAPTIDACALVSSDDVGRILSAEIKSTRPVTETARGVLLYQCYVSTGTARSISIAVAGPMKTASRTVTPRQFWREQFHRSGRASTERGRRRDTDDERGVRPVRGVGDEAFWSGTRVGGALYVLHGDTFIRVSVGGIQDERERIEKSRQLAAAALDRLPKKNSQLPKPNSQNSQLPTPKNPKSQRQKLPTV
ncbi:MAG TPA: hypothetical protein VNR64_18790 [Vicinamibacterales bacterium]|nr:hypothetical protein [Vicinamibacterales bacterium]